MHYPLTFDSDSTNIAVSYGAGPLFAIAVTIGAWLLALFEAVILTTVAVWKINAKAGQPGWAVFVPVYGTIVLLRIGGRSVAWIALLALPLICTLTELSSDTMRFTDPVGFAMLPVVSFGASVTLSVVTGTGLARAFGRSALFGVLALGIVPVVGYPVLGFGRSQPCFVSPQLPGSADTTSDAYPEVRG
jgi:hypothetical protein